MANYIVFVRYFEYYPNSDYFPTWVDLKPGDAAIDTYRRSDQGLELHELVESPEFRMKTRLAELEGNSVLRPIGRFSTMKRANMEVIRLQQNVAKVVSSIDAQASWNSDSLLVATANPRYFAVPEDKLDGDTVAIVEKLLVDRCSLKEYEPHYKAAVQILLGKASALDSATHATPPQIHSPNTMRRPNEARDKWIYDQYVHGTHLAKIRGHLKRRGNWDPLESVQGIRQAALRYAKRHNLTLPPSRHER
jgi:hypothetical protein